MLEKIVITLAGKASIVGLSKEMLFATVLICGQYNELGRDCIITSATDGVHRYDSRHYSGNAIDLRTRHMSSHEKMLIARAVRKELGNDFDVVLESTHLHVEYQPEEEKEKRYAKVRYNP